MNTVVSRPGEKKHRKYRGCGRTRREKHGEKVFFYSDTLQTTRKHHLFDHFLALKRFKNMQQQQQQQQKQLELLFQAPQNGSAARDFLRLSPASLTVRNKPKSEPPPPHPLD